MTTPLPVEAGPTCVSREILVAATPSELFALAADPHRHHELDGSGTVRAEVIGPRRLEPGDRFRVRMRMKGIPYAMTSRATRVVPDRLVEWALPFGHRWRWEFEPVDAGTTRVTESFDYSSARLPAFLRLVKAPERNAAGIEASLQRLRDRYTPTTR